MTNYQKKINTIVNMLNNITAGHYSIALAGAHAKNEADEDSDLDIYMFVDDTKSQPEKIKIIKDFADSNMPIYLSNSYDEMPWGGMINFYYQGTPVEIVIRSFENTKNKIEDALKGKFEIIPATWTSNGYYTYIYLSEISFMIPISDNENFIGYYKDRLIQYPIDLKKAIIKVFSQRANTWLHNFHYLSAIKRKDILFTCPIVMHTILDMIQIIYALNEKYYDGDKKLNDKLKKFNYCPDHLTKNLEFLLSSSNDSELLKKQHELLCVIFEDLQNKIKKEIEM